jgi:Flp pilus assembly protein CpaB
MATKRVPFVILLLAVCALGCAKLGAPESGELRRPLFSRLFSRCFARELLEARYRAVSIPINGYELRHIRTGDRVDVLATFDSQFGGAKRKLTATMLQNVLVMGVDAPCKGQEKGTLILKLNPSEMQYAALGVRQSDLSIALRRDGDNEIYPMEMASFVKFFR